MYMSNKHLDFFKRFFSEVHSKSDPGEQLEQQDNL